MKALERIVIVCIVGLFASVVVANGPAMVIFERDGCGFGWFGCPAETATPVPGGYACPSSEIGLILLPGDQHSVRANDTNDNKFFTCQGRVAFGEINRSFFGDEVVAVERGFVCMLFPDACRGKGAVILNANTIGPLAVCSVDGSPTTNMQEEVTPSGVAHLACFLPDPRPGQP